MFLATNEHENYFRHGPVSWTVCPAFFRHSRLFVFIRGYNSFPEPMGAPRRIALILQGQGDCTKILNLDTGFQSAPGHASITK
jgi:hypothetical protein